ncbi:hypothetical protein BTO20_20475 [Mycobacterium dioxanotrophicus]|jgi:hypothetical protein|uniref:PknH-like extracellular domain-containing protein n=1 Tax=Mycobacterium dioxanotrophicus TaxID=482462 RepID=A0A1Y0C5Z0_9MYCO|nr:hypothetical protein [Mycobacterium dioxanotrophicus]ART70601.1 hypothetical protein BTO20_20475 [Mycobacterium dioxanotrophicus]
MKLTRTFASAAALVGAAAVFTASAAQADPADSDSPVSGGVIAAQEPFSVISVADLPLPAAGWQPVLGHDRTSGVLPGLASCSVDGIPAETDLDRRAAATSPVFVADLRPSNSEGTEGWAGTVSGAGYNGINASSYALASYRRYLDTCRTAPDQTTGYRNAAVGTSVLDPTQAHALLETTDRWVEVFAVATNDGLLEATFTRPKDGPVSFGYNPATVFSALKMADLGALARRA